MFAHEYLTALLIAIDTLQNASQDDIKNKYTNDPIVMASQLPPPAVCDPKYCTLEDPPGCMNLEEPTYGYHQVSIAPPDDALNPYRDRLPEPNRGWMIWKDTEGSKRLIPKAESNDPKCQHLDHCAGATAQNSDDGWLSLKLPKMTRGIVIVCGCCGKQVAKDYFINSDDLIIEFDGKKLDRSTFKVYPSTKCAQVLDGFPPDLEDSEGHLYLGIKIGKINPKNKNIKISHVIAL